MNNDFESLAYHVSESAREQAIQEDYPIIEQPDMRPTMPLSSRNINQVDCE